MGVTEVVPNFIDGSWRKSSDPTALSVTNPATAEEIARVPLTTSMEVEAAALSAAAAFPKWRRTPCGERVQSLGTPTSLFSNPVISPESKNRIGALIEQGVQEGASLEVDGLTRGKRLSSSAGRRKVRSDGTSDLVTGGT